MPARNKKVVQENPNIIVCKLCKEVWDKKFGNPFQEFIWPHVKFHQALEPIGKIFKWIEKAKEK